MKPTKCIFEGCDQPLALCHNCATTVNTVYCRGHQSIQEHIDRLMCSKCKKTVQLTPVMTGMIVGQIPYTILNDICHFQGKGPVHNCHHDITYEAGEIYHENVDVEHFYYRLGRCVPIHHLCQKTYKSWPDDISKLVAKMLFDRKIINVNYSPYLINECYPYGDFGEGEYDYKRSSLYSTVPYDECNQIIDQILIELGYNINDYHKFNCRQKLLYRMIF